jgi:23S rRNA pseudouridine1911/1915/1917 synthase
MGQDPTTIIHADDHLVVVNKAPGISLSTRRSEPRGAVDRLLAGIGAADLSARGIDAGTLLLAHRLDIGTSGLVMLARDHETHRLLSRALSERRVEKAYLALVWGHPRPRAGRYDWPLAPDRRDRRKMKVDPSGAPAATRYRVLADASHVSLVELCPETGRTHQLRVHLAHAGHWIVGDDLYGGPRHRAVKDRNMREALNPSHLLLHAWRLGLNDLPGLSARRFEAPLPAEFLAGLNAVGISVRTFENSPG